MHSRNIKKWALWLLTIMMTLMTIFASAEYGRVITPGGPVKMRKSDSPKGKLVCEIPNRSIIEADDVGEEWCHITYNGKSGWVMTKYLKLASVDDGSGINIQIEPENIHVGDNVHITVNADYKATCRFTVYEGKNVIKGKENEHFDTYYRPRKTGMHCVEVNVKDESGKDATTEVFLQSQKQQKNKRNRMSLSFIARKTAGGSIRSIVAVTWTLPDVQSSR